MSAAGPRIPPPVGREGTHDVKAELETPVALVVAHPGHELLAYGWLSRYRPSVFVVTDGSGRDGQARTAYADLADQNPNDGEIQQAYAQLLLDGPSREDWQQALSFAERSYDIGPRVGEICSRNWRTISVAREHLDDAGGARDAAQRATQCMNTRPKGL